LRGVRGVFGITGMNITPPTPPQGGNLTLVNKLILGKFFFGNHLMKNFHDTKFILEISGASPSLKFGVS